MENWLYTIRSGPLTYFFQGVTFLGNEEFLFFLLPIIYWCWRKRTGFYLIILVTVASYFNILLKSFFAWGRPPAELWLIDVAGYTFPSSHAITAVVLYGFLAYEVKNRYFTALSVSLMVLIAFSRVYLGVHYPVDVVAGLAFGVIVLHLYRYSVKWLGPAVARVNPAIRSVVAFVIGVVMLLIQSDTTTALFGGFFAGSYLGFVIEPHFADFDPHGRWFHNLIKVAVGGVMLLALSQGFEWILPPESVGLKWFESFIVALWITAGAPWLFIQLRIARREQ